MIFSFDLKKKKKKSDFFQEPGSFKHPQQLEIPNFFCNVSWILKIIKNIKRIKKFMLEHVTCIRGQVEQQQYYCQCPLPPLPSYTSPGRGFTIN